MAKTYSISGIATLTGFDRRTVTGRMNGINPADTDGNGARWTLKQVLEAWEAHGREKVVKDFGNDAIDPEYEKGRKDRAMADKYEMENQVRRCELLEITEVRKGWLRILSLVKSRMLSLPSRVAARVASEVDILACNDILMEECRGILDELANSNSAGSEEIEPEDSEE